MRRLRGGSLRAGLLLLLALLTDVYDGVGYSSVYRRLRCPGYQRRSMITLVGKMLKDDEIELDGDEVVLGKNGWFCLDQFMPVFKYRKEHWDGKWRVIIYDVPEEVRTKRNLLRHTLWQYGYGKWQRSVFLTPHPVLEKVTQSLKAHKLFGYAVCLESEQVGGLDNRQLASEVFHNSDRLESWQYLTAKCRNEGKTNQELVSIRREFEGLLERDPWLPEELEDEQIIQARSGVVAYMRNFWQG